MRVKLVAPLVMAVVAVPGTAGAQSSTCDPHDTSRPCLMPFPNDARLTVRDAKTDTGLRVRLPQAAMPANKDGSRIEAREYNRNDGFSPGQTLVARIKGVDPKRLPPLTDLRRSLRRDASIVVIDARTGKRQLLWAELDSSVQRDRLLLIRPAKNWEEGRRYIVAVRRSVGRTARPSARFKAVMRGRGALGKRMRGSLRSLERAGIKRRDLVLAWDFTVASERSLSERSLAMRADAFRQLGDTTLGDGVVQGRAPAFEVTEVREFAPEENGGRLLRRVDGTLTVPCYLDKAGCPVGSRLRYASAGKDALPVQQPGNVQVAKFACVVPRAAQGAPARISLYGHGLLGGLGELNAGNIADMASEHNMVFCGTEWSGMASEDVPNAVASLNDLSNFPSIPDRLQQGFVNFQMLGRLMLHPQGLSTHPSFAGLLDTRALFYDGNSQGGIMGGALTALSVDFRRAVLGVPGMNFSLLLQRSSNWDLYGAILKPAYPAEADRVLSLSLIQMLWDRGEGNGYAHHMTDDPLRDTPAKKVLLQVAFGDWQVTQWAAEIEARTIGARTPPAILDPGRSPDRALLVGIPRIAAFPYDGSAITYWDSGAGRNGPPPPTNTPPRDGKDPHEAPRATPAARVQKSEFLKVDGKVVDVCAGKPCHSHDFAP
jgi:hypothetical protein